MAHNPTRRRTLASYQSSNGPVRELKKALFETRTTYFGLETLLR
jgi:hypothetical protein